MYELGALLMLQSWGADLVASGRQPILFIWFFIVWGDLGLGEQMDISGARLPISPWTSTGL